jgi:hypothetical protein
MPHQANIAKKAIKNLDKGNKTAFKSSFSPVDFLNANSAISNGEMMVDTIANWVDKKYIIGPFDDPPFQNFSVNPLMD